VCPGFVFRFAATTALMRSLNRLELPLHTVGEPAGRPALSALSQRKLNTLGVPIAYVDRSQRYRFANKAFLDWIGKTESELIGREVIEVFGRELFQLYHAYVDAALAGERTSYERRIGAPGRPALWARVDFYPDRGPNGHVRGILVTYTDVNNQKRLELEAGQREHQLRLVTDSIGVPILYFDRQLKLRFVNRPFGDWIGVPPEDVLGHALKDILAPDAMHEMQMHIESTFSGATVSYERREPYAGGESRWIRMTLFPDREVGGRVGGAFAVMNDIEDDVRIRDTLKSQEAQMRLFADNIPGPVAYLDRSLNYTFVNQAFANAVCKPQDAIYGKTPYQILPADVASFIRPILKRAQAGEHVEYERVGTTAQGARRWLHGRVAPDLDGAHKVRGLYCTEYDIHDLKLTEQALAAREEQLRLFTDNIPEPVVYMDADRRYAFINESFLKLTGLARDAIIGKTAAEVLGSDASATLAPFMDRAFCGEAVTYERPIIDATGRARWLRERIVPDFKFDGTD